MDKSSHENKNPRTQSGRLYYIVGASGAGKDSLMEAVCERAEVADHLMIAPRIVTRDAQQSGHDVTMTENAFLQSLDAGEFLFSWQAHGFHYAIGNKILTLLSAGKSVMVNGSRAYIQAVRQRFPAVVIVGVNSAPANLRARLEARGREHSADISERLARNDQYQASLQSADVMIDNEQPLERAVGDFLSVIRQASG